VGRRRATHAGLATIGLALTFASEARAGEMDPTPERLVLQPPGLRPGETCQSVAQNPGAVVAAGGAPQDLQCRPNHTAFANMIAELGFATAPTAFYPARTTGIGGFQLTFEASYTKVNSARTILNGDGTKTRYWGEGTRGQDDPNTKQKSSSNSDPDSLLQVYAVKARKGLVLGFEIAGSLGYVANTTLWVTGGDLRWALLEGFRTGPLGAFPDVSIGGGVRTVTGTSKFYLTTVGLDVRLSKPVNMFDTAQLTPSVGFQRLIILGDSNLLDATPNVDALQQCGYDGPNPTNGTPMCRNKLPNGSDANTDFGNTFTFEKVRVHRSRAMVALNYRYEILWLGSQFAFEIPDPKEENPQLVGSRQWTLSFEGGLFF
jgi:hypothetical protein